MYQLLFPIITFLIKHFLLNLLLNFSFSKFRIHNQPPHSKDYLHHQASITQRIVTYQNNKSSNNLKMEDTQGAHNPLEELTEQQTRDIKDELKLIQRMLDNKILEFSTQTTEKQLMTLKGEAKLLKDMIDRHTKYYSDVKPVNQSLPRMEVTKAIRTASHYQDEIENRLKQFEPARKIPNGRLYRFSNESGQNTDRNITIENTRSIPLVFHPSGHHQPISATNSMEIEARGCSKT